MHRSSPLILSLLVFCALTWFLYRHDIRGACFWDAHVYSRAVSASMHGGDPYSAQSPHLMFVYAPLVLKMMSTARLIFPGRALWYAYLALACAASVCLPVLISLCLGIRWLSIPVSILISSLLPGFMAESAAQRQCGCRALRDGPPGSTFRSPLRQVVSFLRRGSRFCAHQTTDARLSPLLLLAWIHSFQRRFHSRCSSGLSRAASVYARSLSSL